MECTQVHTHRRYAVSSEELITTIYFPKVGYKRILLLLLLVCHLTMCVLQSFRVAGASVANGRL